MGFDCFLVFFVVSMLSGVAMMFVSWGILRFTLDKRVRKALPKDKVYDAFPDAYFGLGRTVVFAGACVLPWAKNSWLVSLYYEGFDVRGYANSFEIFMSYILFLSTFLPLALGVFYMFTDFLKVIPWPENNS